MNKQLIEQAIEALEKAALRADGMHDEYDQNPISPRGVAKAIRALKEQIE